MRNIAPLITRTVPANNPRHKSPPASINMPADDKNLLPNLSDRVPAGEATIAMVTGCTDITIPMAEDSIANCLSKKKGKRKVAEKREQ